jgi:hypothetical protein
MPVARVPNTKYPVTYEAKRAAINIAMPRMPRSAAGMLDWFSRFMLPILIVHFFPQVSARNVGAALPKPGADGPCGQRPAARVDSPEAATGRPSGEDKIDLSARHASSRDEFLIRSY